MASEISRSDSRGGSKPQRVKATSAVVGQVRKIIAESVGGVEIVFRQRERAGGGGRPGIHQRRLDHLILIGAAAHEAAAVFHVDVHVGTQVQPAAQAGNFSRMTVVAMMGLISTAVMSWLPEASARATSQPPPGPMISALAPGRTAYGSAGPAPASVDAGLPR